MTTRFFLIMLCVFSCMQLNAQSLDAAEFDPAVQRLFKAKCVRCHGPNQPKAELDLSSPASIARGGESGGVVLAGKLDKSLLWKRVSADEMPPKQPLTADEKALLKKWIESGAAGLDSTGDTHHWAFRALNPEAKPPEIHHSQQVHNTIDQYVLAKLEQAGLSLGPEADRRTLIRRVSLDVTGLPPTLQEIERFMSDQSTGAYEKMVEHFLASPHYGERWGKHWLDAAGYADSNGYFSADTDRPHAYRYRDYVIRSLNADKPFDTFLREQLAGDELADFQPGEATDLKTIDLLTATHFLRNGQDGTDIGVQEPEAFEIDRRAALEAAVQVTVSSLLGLTVHCARCHDHKFEPITQKEYYQFQAILFPAFNPQDWVNPKDRVIYGYLPGEKELWDENEQRIKQELASNRDEFTEFLNANREPSELLFHETFSDDSWKSRWSNTAPGDDKPGGTLTIDGKSANAARVVDGTLQIISGPAEAWLSTTMPIDWTPDETGDWIQASFTLVDNKVGGGPAMRIGYTIAAQDYDDSGTVGGGNILVDGNPTTATQLYADYPGSDQQATGQIGQQGYVPGRNYGVRVTNIGDNKYRLDHVVDGLPDGKTFEVTAADLPDGGFAFFYSSSRSYVVDDVRVEKNRSDARSREEIDVLRKKLAEKRKVYEERRSKLESQRTPEPGRAIAWVTDKSPKPPEVPLLTRGLYHLRGPGVEPGAFQMLTDPGHEYQPRTLSDDATTTGRRLGFADWLLRVEGRPAALLARVHTNRIWREYFGRGIVATTDNLGQSGASPTHAKLLDDLALSLIQSGWKQKELHRRILHSAVYRQSAAARPDGLAKDPGNRLLWRHSVRRLQAEVIRDAMLAVSGQLDPTQFGPYVPTRQTPVGEVVVNPQDAGAFRRSVYLQQRRSQTLSMLKVFDAPAIATICTARPSSTVPLQSLALLNSDFAISTAGAFAKRLLAETDATDENVVDRAWQIAVAREPTARERSLSIEFLTGQRTKYTGDDAPTAALSDFCQMLLASHAFLYVE